MPIIIVASSSGICFPGLSDRVKVDAEPSLADGSGMAIVATKNTSRYDSLAQLRKRAGSIERDGHGMIRMEEEVREAYAAVGGADGGTHVAGVSVGIAVVVGVRHAVNRARWRRLESSEGQGEEMDGEGWSEQGGR